MPQRLEQIVNCDNKPLTNTSKSLTRLRRFKKKVVIEMIRYHFYYGLRCNPNNKAFRF